MMTDKGLSVQERKDIFFALVSAQDTHKRTVADTKRQIIKQFNISASTLEEITEEGVDNEWLDEMAKA
jgi:hypothetical protein